MLSVVLNQPLLESEIPHILLKLHLDMSNVYAVFAITSTPDAPHLGMYNEGMFEITRVQSIPFTDQKSEISFLSTEFELPFRDPNKIHAFLILVLHNGEDVIIARYGTTEAGSGIYDVHFLDPDTPIHSIHNLPESFPYSATIHEKLCLNHTKRTVDPNILQWIDNEREKHLTALQYLDTLKELLFS